MPSIARRFFGDELYHELRHIKTAFDPDNRLNPGKICPPLATDAPMLTVDAVKRGTFDRKISVAVRGAWRGAMECNGTGLCFNFDTLSPMCPSMKITANRIHSPKGRATLVREWLRLLAQQGVDQALVLCYRDEYREVLGAARGDFQVQLVHEWLAGLPTSGQTVSPAGQAPAPAAQTPWYLFGHCTEATQLQASARQWREIFARYGARLEPVSVGCCGMAGTYGHESANYAHSRGIYALSWQQQLAQLPRGRCLATDYSCRSQVKRIEGEGIRHPLQALLEIIA